MVSSRNDKKCSYHRLEIDIIIYCFSCVAQMPEVDSAGPGFSSGESERLLVSNGKQVTLLTLMKMSMFLLLPTAFLNTDDLAP